MKRDTLRCQESTLIELAKIGGVLRWPDIFIFRWMNGLQSPGFGRPGIRHMAGKPYAQPALFCDV